MFPRAAACVALLGLVACATKQPQGLYQPWTFEARVTAGEVRVVPIVQLHSELEVDTRSYVGIPLPHERLQKRKQQTEALARVPDALAEALPGAVNGQLGLAWHGQFHHASWPLGAADKVHAALNGERALDVTLEEVAGQIGGEATLFTWVRELDGLPLSTLAFPGQAVPTPIRPVTIDHTDEPYLVNLLCGLALVTADGEVVIRYEDVYQTVLSGKVGPDRAAADMAAVMAEEVTKVWATEAELNRRDRPRLVKQD